MPRILALIIVLMPTLASAECLTYKEARKENPGYYLSWRGKHCWYAPTKEKERNKEERPSRRAKPDTVSTPVSEGSSPSMAATPLPLPSLPPAPLTEDALIQYGVEHPPVESDMRSLSFRLDDMMDRLAQVVTPWNPARSDPFDRERILRAVGIIMFTCVVLTMLGVVTSKMFYRIRNLT